MRGTPTRFIPCKIIESCYFRMLKGLERLQKKCEEGGSQLINVLLGQSLPSTVQIMDDIAFFDDTLNDSQKEAVKFALGSPEISLIHGPPGVKKKKCRGNGFNVSDFRQERHTH